MYNIEQFDLNERIHIDTETISWDDDREALYPYKGDKISTIIVGQRGKKTVAISLRNRNGSKLLVPLDDFLPWFKQWALTVKIYVGQKAKFDLRMFAQDGVFFKNARIEDTPVLARLINNDMMEYGQEFLCKFYGVKHQKSSEVARYCKDMKTKDYGRAPADMLQRYGIQDVEGNMDLHELLLKKLPEECQFVWDNECKMCSILFELEHRGILIDKYFLQKRSLQLLQTMMDLILKIRKETEEVIHNPGSTDQIDTYFTKIGIAPLSYNKPTVAMLAKGLLQGNACWNSENLEQINHPVARLLVKYKDAQTQNSNFCESWLREADANHRIHPDFRSDGTKTGRISAAEPNVYNPPKWCMEAFVIPNGYIGVKWDKKQIEYRLFAHYSGDENLLNEYARNPNIDYHQILATILGIPRDPTKTINFGILYGMGQAKLKRRLAVQFAEIEADESTPIAEKQKIRIALRRYVAHTELIVPDTGPIEAKIFDVAAEAILKEYHQRTPAIKVLQKKVKEVVRVRGYIRNFYKRHYHYPVEFAYVATNALIQGSAADFFKVKIIEMHEKCDKRVELIDMIYDSYFAIMPIECAQEYWELSKKIIADAPFKVPVLIDGEVALGNFKNITKIIGDDVLASAATICKLSKK